MFIDSNNNIINNNGEIDNSNNICFQTGRANEKVQYDIETIDSGLDKNKKVPIGAIIYDKNNKERVIITYRNFEKLKDLDEELWKFKMPIKLKHNEGALNQHEVVCFHYPSNIALDNNNLLMKILQETAKKHNFRCRSCASAARTRNNRASLRSLRKTGIDSKRNSKGARYIPILYFKA